MYITNNTMKQRTNNTRTVFLAQLRIFRSQEGRACPSRGGGCVPLPSFTLHICSRKDSLDGLSGNHTKNQRVQKGDQYSRLSFVYRKKRHISGIWMNRNVKAKARNSNFLPRARRISLSVPPYISSISLGPQLSAAISGGWVSLLLAASRNDKSMGQLGWPAYRKRIGGDRVYLFVR